VTLVLAGAGPLLAAYLGLGQALGAHPWWAVRVFYPGLAGGAVLALLMRQWRGWPGWKLGLLVGLLALALVVAEVARTRFIAAEAFDVTAGRIWYFGWIGIVAAVLALLVEAIAGERQRP